MYLNHSAQEGTDSFSDSNEGESVVQVHTGSSCDVLSCDVVSCDVLSCDVLSCDVLSCDVLSWDKRIVKFGLFNVYFEMEIVKILSELMTKMGIQ